jgi:hypothetical protein
MFGTTVFLTISKFVFFAYGGGELGGPYVVCGGGTYPLRTWMMEMDWAVALVYSVFHLWCGYHRGWKRKQLLGSADRYGRLILE